ncbi:aldehyde dehydrogenase (NADP(+)) [Microbispora sp. NEAU-D428]|uniref:aldehyde dehydrogenase (NADP(+)) n=1 Tax=Microbispora sitophila TaxID=2771537 RepID=UPI0018679975|nr:aldehyde dehydrogenase (NADP(+)) [Microbispora sitophila]
MHYRNGVALSHRSGSHEAGSHEAGSHDTSPQVLTSVLAASAASARPFARTTPEERSRMLHAVAAALDAHAEELVPLAEAETHLPEPRLRGELKRTSFQARLMGDRLRQGLLADVRIDHADPGWPMGPRPDIRRTTVPLGPVLVFAASNFPFAFSVAGGDSVSALAAGCPVVVKAHPGHPRLSRRTAEVVAAALGETGAPEGVFALIEGVAAGVAAVQDPRVRAVAFTGSLRGGRHLFDLACARDEPIPFYGELGSTNPVVITPSAWRSRAEEVARGLAASFTLGSGQFCTKPGIVLVPDASALVAALPPVHSGPMLTPGLTDGFRKSLDELSATPGVEVALVGEPLEEGVPAPVVLRTTAATVLADPRILELECFGPSTLLVEYVREDEVYEVVGALRGQLTATVQAGPDDDELALALVPLLAEHAGRVLWNDWPTGVTVSDAQQHGGPYPASTAPATTSVGTGAVARFLRPVAFQNLPDAALPAELRDGASGPRLVDGHLKTPR